MQAAVCRMCRVIPPLHFCTDPRRGLKCKQVIGQCTKILHQTLWRGSIRAMVSYLIDLEVQHCVQAAGCRMCIGIQPPHSCTNHHRWLKYKQYIWQCCMGLTYEWQGARRDIDSIPDSSRSSELYAGGCVSQVQSDPPSPCLHKSSHIPAITRRIK